MLTLPCFPDNRKYPTGNCGWSGPKYTGLYTQQGEPDHNGDQWRTKSLSGERWTARKTEKRTCDSKPECKQQKQRHSLPAKKQIKTAVEVETENVTIEVCNTAAESLVLQIRDNVELYESNGELTFTERAQLRRAVITYLMAFQNLH